MKCYFILSDHSVLIDIGMVILIISQNKSGPSRFEGLGMLLFFFSVLHEVMSN